MGKKIKVFVISIVITIVVLIVLFITKEYTLNHMYGIIMKLRGSGNLEGETLALETMTILFTYLLPSIFILTLIFVLKFKPFKHLLKY